MKAVFITDYILFSFPGRHCETKWFLCCWLLSSCFTSLQRARKETGFIQRYNPNFFKYEHKNCLCYFHSIRINQDEDHMEVRLGGSKWGVQNASRPK